ncbi:putative sugar ABC transporter, periplasmic component [Candidatus Vecturithrix granuli]|uniref:Putative sugar ABC transporter, periplasmic component n=1 Tax=Vecturithrix granuli TaxID=1499967 RepID=A0A081BWD0_VECG1|nr:putative sugar ABC transporter, periplasmic component [Candidatus Vecturithrix granuli]
MKKSVVFWVVIVSISLLLPCFPGNAKAEGWGNIDWQQFKGTELNVLATAMPVSEVYKKRIEKFEELTGIKVNFELLNDVDRRKKQLVDFSSGMGEYDLGNIGFSNREEFAQPGYLEPLEQYLEDPKLTDKAWYNFADYPKDVIASGYSKDKLVFVPFTAEYFLLWYRKDIFNDLGLSVPKNFEELRATSEKLDEARKAGKIKEYAWIERQMPGASEAGWNLFCTANRFGGFDFINFGEMVSYVNTPKGHEVLDYYTSMVKQFAPPGSGNWTWGEIAVAFKTEQVAMTTGGNASYAYLENPKESKVAGRVGYAPPPMAEGGKDPLWVWGWGMNKDSKHKGAAWLFIQWATSPTLMQEIAPEYGCPARQSSYANPAYVQAMPSQEFIDAQLYMMTQGVNPYPQLIHAKYAEGADIVSKEMSNIIAGIKDVKQAAADADQALIKLGYKPAE